MLFKTTPENVVAKVATISSITLANLTEMGLKAHRLGTELLPDYGEFPTWIRDRVAEDFALMIGGTEEQPIWSDDMCPLCGGALGANPNLAPGSGSHRLCVAGRAESLTHDDSRECGAVAPRNAYRISRRSQSARW